MRLILRRFAFACGALLSALVAHAHSPAVDMAEAAQKFLGSLSPEQRKHATFALTDAERENWNFVPVRRRGLSLKQMNAAQIENARALLRTGLGQRGIMRAEAIIALELVLQELEGSAYRDPSLYFVTIFGEPALDKSWGWRFEGHHLAFNFTVVDGAHVFFTPSFMGSNPAEVPSGPRRGERVLGEEDDLGRDFLKSLDPAQQKIAVIAVKAPSEIITLNHKRADPLSPVGIRATQLTPAQRARLVALVKLYLDRWRPELAESTFAAITVAGIDDLSFAWAGSFERGQPNYYRIQGPTFLIEFDNTQNRANHIHTTVRDFKGDFGHDLLREHYEREHTK